MDMIRMSEVRAEPEPQPESPPRGNAVDSWRELTRRRDELVGVVPPEELDPLFATLSPREREVLVMLVDGRRKADVAADLGISIKTVESHRGSAMNKLKLRGTGQLTHYALAMGLTALGRDARR
jgi:DNA-binding CsgD family transcriptional regulator